MAVKPVGKFFQGFKEAIQVQPPHPRFDPRGLQVDLKLDAVVLLDRVLHVYHLLAADVRDDLDRRRVLL